MRRIEDQRHETILRGVDGEGGFGLIVDGFVEAMRATRKEFDDTVIPMSNDPLERFEALLASGKDSPLLRFSSGMQYLKAS
jgi:hypothetical protein